jgi:dTMP kinase
MSQNKIIVFEGIDGSGKGTQSKLLYKYYQKANIPSILIEFPNYENTFFGKVVGEFLNGDFGNINQVNPKLAAILYAGDRFEKSSEIYEYINKGYTIICDRYIPSNIAHQIAKVSISEQKKLRDWIEELEYSVFNLPKPDIILFMDMHPDISSKFVLKKEKRVYTDKNKDIHEKDESYLKKVYSIFKNMSYEKKWNSIDCNNKNIESVHNTILKVLGET